MNEENIFINTLKSHSQSRNFWIRSIAHRLWTILDVASFIVSLCNLEEEILVKKIQFWFYSSQHNRTENWFFGDHMHTNLQNGAKPIVCFIHLLSEFDINVEQLNWVTFHWLLLRTHSKWTLRIDAEKNKRVMLDLNQLTCIFQQNIPDIWPFWSTLLLLWQMTNSC